MDKLLTDIMLELHVPDFKVVKEFYGNLGFEVVWEKIPNERNISYLVMRRGLSIINFYGGSHEVYNHQYMKKFSSSSPRGYAVEIIIPIDDIKSYFKKMCEIYPLQIVEKINNEHSHVDFRMVDPFGFYLRFVERYNWVKGRDKKGKEIISS